jgi:hypothetical protein
MPYLWIAQGATVAVPLTARVMSSGSPKSGATVNFAMIAGAGTLSAPSANADANGYAKVTLTLTQLAANVQLNACVAPANSPCQAIYGSMVAPALLSLQPVTGSAQAIVLGKAFQPLTVCVVDNSSPPNPVLGAPVLFQSTLMRPAGDSGATNSGETSTGNPTLPVILSVTQTTVQTDANGLASIVPTVGAFNGVLEVHLLVTAGTNATLSYVLDAFPPMASGSAPTGGTPPKIRPRPAPVRTRLPVGKQ